MAPRTFLCALRLSALLICVVPLSLPSTIVAQATSTPGSAGILPENSTKPVSGQDARAPSQPPATSDKSTTRSKANSAAEKARLEQQKALALSLLVSLSNDARSFPDQKLRARTLSRIADALWEVDPEQGRALFRRAWDAAEVGDQEAARRADEDRQRQQGGNAPVAMVGGPDLRAEVLRLAAKRDRALGEELLDKLKDAGTREATEASSPARSDPFDASAAVRQRLRLASQLLESDVERALQFADPALVSVTMEGLDFSRP